AEAKKPDRTTWDIRRAFRDESFASTKPAVEKGPDARRSPRERARRTSRTLSERSGDNEADGPLSAVGPSTRVRVTTAEVERQRETLIAPRPATFPSRGTAASGALPGRGSPGPDSFS